MSYKTGTAPARPSGARAGNFVVTTFMISLGLMVAVAGVNAMMRTQINNANEIQRIGIAKLQATYLAEMALNQVMFDANTTPGAADPWGIPINASTGKKFNFKSNVAMTRALATGVAECTVLHLVNPDADGAQKFQVQARLVVDSGTYNRIVNFSAKRKSLAPDEQWYLASYALVQ